jgi:hypothetical protein
MRELCLLNGAGNTLKTSLRALRRDTLSVTYGRFGDGTAAFVRSALGRFLPFVKVRDFSISVA